MDNDIIKRRIKTQILKSYKIFNHTHLRLISHQLQMVGQIHPAISAVLETIIFKQSIQVQLDGWKTSFLCIS